MQSFFCYMVLDVAHQRVALGVALGALRAHLPHFLHELFHARVFVQTSFDQFRSLLRLVVD